MAGKYDDIINLPHHVSAARPHMPLPDRAAQFSPFAALTGYDEAVKETARLTGPKHELDDSAKEELNKRLMLVREKAEAKPQITVTYFLPDGKKSGGEYVSVSGAVGKIDSYAQAVIMADGRKIPIDDISELEGELFAELS